MIKLNSDGFGAKTGLALTNLDRGAKLTYDARGAFSARKQT